MFPEALLAQATDLLAACRAQQLKLATAESCTGGLIAGLLTEIAGSSDVVDRGFITYSNAAKEQMLGVDAMLLKNKGAVSAEVALAMAQGALKKSKADIAIAVTGIAGPGGGTERKPVGLVYIAAARGDKALGHEYHFFGERSEVRLAAIRAALVLAEKLL